MKKIAELRKSEKGQAFVEFIFVLPLLLLLVFGMAETGMILNAKITATQAAREGARASVVLPEGSNYVTGATTKVNNYMTNIGISSDKYEVLVPVPSGDSLSVTVTYKYNPINGYLWNVIPGLPNPLRLESKVIMRIE